MLPVCLSPFIPAGPPIAPLLPLLVRWLGGKFSCELLDLLPPPSDEPLLPLLLPLLWSLPFELIELLLMLSLPPDDSLKQDDS